MKKYRINNTIVTVRENSLAHKFIKSKYGIPMAFMGAILLAITGIYVNTIMWAGILG